MGGPIETPRKSNGRGIDETLGSAFAHHYWSVLAGHHCHAWELPCTADGPRAARVCGDSGSPSDKPRVEWFPAGQNGNIYPNRVLAGPHTGITSPRGLALDGSGRLFVADQLSSRVLVFDADANGDAAPVITLTGFKSPD